MSSSNTVIKSQYLLYFVFWLLGLVLLVAACKNIYSRSQTSWTAHFPTCPSATQARKHSKVWLVWGPRQDRYRPPLTLSTRSPAPESDSVSSLHPEADLLVSPETAVRWWLHPGQIASHVKQTTGNSNLLGGGVEKTICSNRKTVSVECFGTVTSVFNHYFSKSLQVSLLDPQLLPLPALTMKTLCLHALSLNLLECGEWNAVGESSGLQWRRKYSANHCILPVKRLINCWVAQDCWCCTH